MEEVECRELIPAELDTLIIDVAVRPPFWLAEDDISPLPTNMRVHPKWMEAAERGIPVRIAVSRDEDVKGEVGQEHRGGR